MSRQGTEGNLCFNLFSSWKKRNSIEFTFGLLSSFKVEQINLVGKSAVIAAKVLNYTSLGLKFIYKHLVMNLKPLNPIL